MFPSIALIATAFVPLVSAAPLPSLARTALSVFPNLSQNCSSTLQSLLVNPQASCLNVGALNSLASLANGSSVVPVIDSWAKGVCNIAPCSSDFMYEFALNVSTNCLPDINSVAATYSLPNASQSLLEDQLQGFYPLARNITCLEDLAQKQLCPTYWLTELQALVGTIVPSQLTTIFSESTAIFSAPNNNITCSGCTQVAYGMANATNLPQTMLPFTTELNAVCPATFISNAVINSAISSAESSAPIFNISETALQVKNGALHVSMAGPAAIATIATVAAFLV